MSYKFAELKHVDERSEYIVYGFIREVQNLLPSDNNPYFNIPQLANYLCLMYYVINEFWEIIGFHITKSDDELTLQKAGYHDWDNTSYGHKTIQSKGNYIYKWYIKLGTSFLTIGIASNYTDTNDGFQYNTNAYNYCVYNADNEISDINNRGKVCGYIEEIVEGDTICIELNTKNGALIFHINGKSQGKIADVEQRIDIQYKLATCLYANTESVKIIGFETIRKN